MAASREDSFVANSSTDSENSAPRAVSNYLNDMVNSRDLQEIMESQNAILLRFEKSNETLNRVNSLSQSRLDVLTPEFNSHIAMLTEMKRNLDSIFKRIRILKHTVQTKYPEAYDACKVTYSPPDGEDDEERTPVEDKSVMLASSAPENAEGDLTPEGLPERS